jgi:hypothetical protein
MMEGVNSTTIYYKTFVNVTMYLQYNNNVIINFLKRYYLIFTLNAVFYISR